MSLRYTLLFFLLLWVAELKAQKRLIDDISLGLGRPFEQLSIKHWTVEQGLPFDAFLDIKQGLDGYIYLAGYDGLVRYDGNTFKHFEKANQTPLRGLPVYKMLVFSDSSLWLAGIFEGLLEYKNGVFKVHTNPKWKKQLSFANIFKMNKTQFWAITTTGINLIFDTESKKFIEIKHKELFEKRLTDLLCDKEGNIWAFAAENVVYYYQNQTLKILGEKNGLNKAINVERGYEDSRGTMWIGTSQGLYYWDKKKEYFEPIKELKQNYIKAIFDDKQGNLWIGTTERTFRMKLSTRQIEIVPEDDLFDTYGFVLDHEKSLWAVTYRRGMWHIRSGLFSSFNTNHNPNNKEIDYIMQDSNQYWIGTGNKLMSFESVEGFKNYPLKYEIKSGMRHIFKDSKKNLWLATYTGVIKIAPNGKQTLYDKNNILGANFTRHFMEDEKGRIWIATHTHGIIIFDPETEKITFLDKNKGLASNFVMSIRPDAEKNIWVGTNNNGFNLIDKNGNIKHWNKENGLTENVVFNIKIDSQKTAWIATQQGLSRLKNGKITNYKLNYATSIFDIIEDHKGYFWLPTNTGILRVAKQDFEAFDQDSTFQINWKLYDKEDGLPNDACKGARHAYQDQKGNIFVPMTEGLAIIKPNYVSENKQIPQIDINEMWVNDQSLELKEHIVLKPDQHRIVIGFSGLSFIDPTKMKFKFKMIGYDTDWNVANKDRKAIYTNLPAGTYIFQVIGSNNDGYWNEKGDTLQIIILPFWWQTWWAKTLFLGFIVGIILFFYTWQIHRIEKQKIELEQQIRLKNVQVIEKNTELLIQTEELQKTHAEVLTQRDTLKKSYENIALLSEIGKRITASLEIDGILEAVYYETNKIMDTSVFLIGLYEPEQEAILTHVFEEKKRLPNFHFHLTETSRLATWCFVNQKEIFMNDCPNEWEKYAGVPQPAAKMGKNPVSLLYLPLVQNEKRIGILSVQSFVKNAYSQTDLGFLRNIAVYITIALENSAAYRELQSTLNHLKQTQSQLVQAEKMAGIGTLTAGIAHEINNPINFVKNHIGNIEANLADILAVVKLYESITPETVEAKLLEIKALKKSREFDIAIEEMDILIQGIREGANRTAEIVKGLRTFTRLDDQVMKAVNLHENLDATLMLLKNQYKDRIQVIKNYGEMPLIDCFIGKINQIFMNLLSNAMQAIEEEGTITITTELLNLEGFENLQGLGKDLQGVVQVKIRDSGTGIPVEIRDRIFEPFFTTKDVGLGTGLGLSISLGIARNHGGDLTFTSEIGQGTEFVLTLPI